MPARTATVALIAWSAAVLTLTLGPLRWHIDYFSGPGPQYRSAIIAVLCLLGLAATLYPWLRRRALWQWEPRLLAGAALAVVIAREPVAFLIGFAMAASCYALGAFSIARLGIDVESPAARIPLAIGIGLGAWIIALFPLGLAGLYRPWVIALLLAGVCFALRRHIPGLPRDLRELDRAWRSSPELQSPLAGVAVVFAPAFLAVLLLAALAPAISYDAVSHHLPAARHYLLRGALTPLPDIPGSYSGRLLFSIGHSVAYSYYPQSFEELLTAALALGGQPCAQLLTPLFFLLSLLMAVAIARECGLSRLAAAVGGAAAATLPFALWTGAVVKNDSPLAFFELTSLYAVVRSRRRALDAGPNQASPPPTGWLLLAAFFLGLSFGIKHVALFAAIPLGLLLLDEIRRRRQPLRLAFLVGLVFAASGTFWHVRTFVLTGSPIYPARPVDASRTVRALDGSRPSRWTVHLQYPWMAHFDGHKVMESPTANPLGFFFVFFAATWLIARRRERSAAERACLFFVALYYLYWAYIWGVLRYALAPAMILAMLTAGRAVSIERHSGRAARFILSAALAYCLAFALLPSMILSVNAYQFAYLTGRLDQTAYLRATMADYRAIDFLNRHSAPDEQILAVNNCATAYADDPARFRCVKFHAMLPERAELVGELVEATQPDYLVLPATPYADPIRTVLAGSPYTKAVYRDEAFEILRRN